MVTILGPWGHVAGMGGAKRAGNPRADDYRAAGRQQQGRFDRAGQALSCRFGLTLRRRAGASARKGNRDRNRAARTDKRGERITPALSRFHRQYEFRLKIEMQYCQNW
ncbi:hypothetical protein QHI69_33620 [Burkholderia gladioli pv. gladioli]|uniref:hypothetical protein n=1 Tax=Burkholderia gladioli TaxID=28095 RepID=UPI0011874081|nr:hypothetical protein [Burkholderia gladioli]MDJ1166854.1 hypothetical protein [Burkholderia gladioli pv. gladioli]